ncbi:LysE family translocator [Thalassospira xiamenensis]|uniref:Resistance to homoserine/threonine (RhtB) family protein n=1 Tax=Thalassospira xiamenensis TaxID=220697 RepID=A0A285RL78_9PROT|nr:LysE family translocator [Thalassospira xiamenensis]SOB94855.1 resistance to homoserine/threonine (RhtB) family protein [Thalassospira xiamenensis]
MDATITLISVFAIFIPALMLPGPDFVAVVRSSMTRGTKAGLQTTIGVSAGLGLYAMLSLLGLSTLLVEYQWLTWTVRVLGGCYLIYLGMKLIRARPKADDFALTSDETTSKQRGNPVLFGFLVTMTNPKAIVLFASVFATAVTAETPVWLMVLMIGLVILSALVWYTIISLFMSSAPVMKRFTHAQHWIERVAGVCFIAIGGRILADARNPVSP